MADNRNKFGFWLDKETSEKIDTYMKIDNCATRSEFVEKAVLFYIGYLNAKNAGAFLPETLSTMLEGTLDAFSNRMGALLLKVALEQNMCNHILIEDTDMDDRDYQLLRGRCLREVKSTNGRISFKDALDFQKTV